VPGAKVTTRKIPTRVIGAYDLMADLRKVKRTSPATTDWGPNDSEKKADVVKHPEVFRHVGLLFDKPPGTAELLFT